MLYYEFFLLLKNQDKYKTFSQQLGINQIKITFPVCYILIPVADAP